MMSTPIAGPPVALLPGRRPVGAVALLGPAGPMRDHVLRTAAPEAATIAVGPRDALFGRLDVAGNVDFPLRARRLDGTEIRRVRDTLLALVGLEREGSRSVASLSGPERALLLAARAAATGRAALLVDGLAAGLDGDGRERVFAALRRLVRLERLALVYATGDRADAFAVADRIAVLDGSAIAGFDTPDALMTSPGSALVAEAIAAANVLVARIGGGSAGDENDPAEDRDEAEATLSSGRTMPARLSDGVRPGALCLLAVPPARIAFAPVPPDRMGEGAIGATLIDHRHAGTHLRLRLRLEDGVTITVHRPLGSLSARDAARAAEPLGASVAWRAADATAFPHPDA